MGRGNNRRQIPPLALAGGDETRFLLIFSLCMLKADNKDLFHTYQGLTDDGQHWGTAILPINHPMLPDDATNPLRVTPGRGYSKTTRPT